jgi:hypothetical protein
MALLVVLMIVLEVKFYLEQVDSLFCIDWSGEANYVMRVFLSARSVQARIPESFVRKVSELVDGGCYEAEK